MEQLAATAKKKKDTLQKTLHIRVKDRHTRVLLSLAREVNQVFNYCNELSSRAIHAKIKNRRADDMHKFSTNSAQS